MEFEPLKLKNQLCFPLYACSKEVVKKYKPFLNELNLTYTQYIVMLVLWEEENINVKELGDKLYLDSGTLTPLLKKMEKNDMVSRQRSNLDERNLIVSLTEKGQELKNRAVEIPKKLGECLPLSNEEIVLMYKLTYKMLNGMK